MVAITAVAHRIPAGWYRDKDDASRRRWWDGIEWTDHYAPVTDQLTTDPRMSALLESIGSRVERAIAPQPEPLEQSEHHGAGSAQPSDRADHAVHSSEIPITAMAATATTRRRVPLAVVVLLAALTGANTVLLGILVSGR
jgi:hypothetical protein